MIYKIEFHRVWVINVEAESREQAREIANEDMVNEPDAEDYSYSVIKQDNMKPSGKGKTR